MDRRERVERIVLRIAELSGISEDAGRLTRRYGTTAFVEAAGKVLGWMKEAGLEAGVDAIGNVRGRLYSSRPGAKTLVIGSHIDTVVDAGRWDGPLGVLMGLEIVEEVLKSGLELPFHIELVAFCDEEGVRYQSTYLGSRAMAGRFDRGLLERVDAGGVRLGHAIMAAGGDPSPEGLAGAVLDAGQWLGYFEIHIEQGPVLYEAKVPVAVVSGIAGQVRATVRFEGRAGHAGTVPMGMRSDALCGAAEWVLAVERMAAERGIVATVGKLEVAHGASNVIPGEVRCSVDIRSADMRTLSLACEDLRYECGEIAMRRGLAVGWDVTMSTEPVTCEAEWQGLLAGAIAACAYPVLTLASGAGHDAVAVSVVAPVSMMFVRCYKGISHHPAEDVETSDVLAALTVGDEFIRRLGEHYSSIN